ncbi:MAG: hypothetical protein DRI61_04735 [Chloroflexi bacterium]|nr:MAG: hypothetical protein DRI61_04735 [Chloroflexota bacterium]
MSEAGTKKKAVLDGLLTILDSISDFKDHVYGGYRPPSAVRAEKMILVHLVEDVQTIHLTDEDIHSLQFNILVKYRTDIKDDPKDEMDSFIDLVGKVEDKLKSNYYREGAWDNLEINRINYTFGQERDFVFYNALIQVSVRLQW